MSIRRPFAGATVGEVILAAAAFYALYALLAGAALAFVLLAVHAAITAALYPYFRKLIPAVQTATKEEYPSYGAARRPPGAGERRFYPPSWARLPNPPRFNPDRLRERFLERFGQY